MLLIKLLSFVLVVSLVNSVPIDKRESSDRNRPSTRRSTLEMYRFNHPPSISIPVSVVFEESEPGNDKSGKSLKLSTENPDKKPSLSQKPSSVAIPVSVVFEEKISDKSKNINTNIPDKNPLLPESLSVAIPVSVVLEEETSVSNKSEKSKNLNPKISEAIPVLAVSEEKESQSEKALNSNQQSDVAVPVAVIFEEEEFSNFNALKSVKPSSDSTHNKQVHTEKTKIIDQQTVRPILTNTVSDNDIEVLTTNTTNVKTKLKEEPSKVILNPQPRQYYQLEYQIPVAVVYDDPINAVQMRRKLKKLKDQVRGRNSRRRRPTSTSTTEPTIEVTTSDENIQGNPLSNEDKPHNSRRQRVKQTQAKLSDKEDIPVVTKLPVDGIQKTKPNSREQRFSTTLVPTTEASSKKQTSNTRTPLQTQNRNASFKAQQTEERKQDNESARKRERDPIIPIVKSDIHAYGNSGSFSYSYEGGDGTKAFGKGELKTFEDDKTGETVVGGFSYKDQDGKDISLTYTADENGYRPVGDHLPTPPPIPVAIQRALDYLATKTTPAAVTEASQA